MVIPSDWLWLNETCGSSKIEKCPSHPPLFPSPPVVSGVSQNAGNAHSFHKPKPLQEMEKLLSSTNIQAHTTYEIEGPYAFRSAGAILKFLIIFEQGALRFHFAVGSASYVASPEWAKTDVYCSHGSFF